MKENEEGDHIDRTPEEIKRLREKRGLHPVWEYEGGKNNRFSLDGETYLDLLAGNPLRHSPEPDDEDLAELIELMGSEPNR